MRKVPTIDASGMHALREFHFKCQRQKTTLILSGISSSLFQSLKKFGVIDLVGEEQTFSSLDSALKHASKLAKEQSR